ncbi:TonB-dependent receptor plug domain-containing protein [Hylemonella gracilis]|uniref:TonB-dependent receptor plug domain-containing protein n=1 Tax=Hylemonella gracilis TaxID=80880 RepID=UPI001F604BD4|nr:TonB-dependent receptor [Hylemonella gracilis]
MKFPPFFRVERACMLGAFPALTLVHLLALKPSIVSAAEPMPSPALHASEYVSGSRQQEALPGLLPSERDYLDVQMPVVLSVSRLPQRPDEIPGAVTVIDRRMIQASGARDVVDLLRLVPGFAVSNSYEDGTAAGSYHSQIRTTFPNQMQLMVDGRSVYSLYLAGSTGPGLQTVALDDIERIEIYRGSNSAAYGARAFLGSVNIVTRDLAETQGVMARVTRGVGEHGAGVEDWGLRLGGSGEATRMHDLGMTGWRLSADRRRDDNLRGTSGPLTVQRLNLRADLNASMRDQVELRAGQSQIAYWLGWEDQLPGPHTRTFTTRYAQIDWRRTLDEDHDLLVQLSHTHEDVDELVAFNSPSPITGQMHDNIPWNFSGQARSTNLLAQNTVRLDAMLRVVWGGEVRREETISEPLYGTTEGFVEDFTRLFANVEWHFAEDWLLNAGVLAEHSTLVDDDEVAPRLMVNWHAADLGTVRHTVRAGRSRAFRSVSVFERNANVRFRDSETGQDLGYLYDASLGNPARAERIDVKELGWLAESGSIFSFDLRVFEEHLRDVVVDKFAPKPGGVADGDPKVFTYVNGQSFDVRGAEAQLRWKPWRGAQLHYTRTSFESGQRMSMSQSSEGRPVPGHRSQGLLYIQRLPWGVSASLFGYEMGDRIYPNAVAKAPPYSRVDARLAKTLRLDDRWWAGRQAELSMTWQNIDGDDADHSKKYPQYFQRRVFVALQLGY